jgi:hypothetical protein
VVLTLATAAALVVGGLPASLPASAVDVVLVANTSSQPAAAGLLSVSGFGAFDNLLVGVALKDAPFGTTFAFASTSGLTPAYGYGFTNTMREVSFAGTLADINAALATMLISTGPVGGPFTIYLSASLNSPNLYYNATNDHFYSYVAGERTWTSALAGAQTQTVNGATGYLVTITDAQENDFIAHHTNTSNVWIGATDRNVEGTWTWASGPEAGITFWSGMSSGTTTPPFNYASWATSQPSNSGGNENYGITNWRGTLGLWNDSAETQRLNLGYIAEFSPPISGYSGVSSTVLSASVTSPPSAPVNVTAVAGDGQAQVTWEVPNSVGDSPITNYRVTATPTASGCTTDPATLTCTITGLTNGVPYTFAVEATNAQGWGISGTSASVTPLDSRVRLILNQGTRINRGVYDRIRTSGTTTGIRAGTRLTAYFRYRGETTFRRGHARILVQPDGSFTWTRKVGLPLTFIAYITLHAHESKRVVWAELH